MEEGLVAATVTAAYNNGEDSPHPEMAPEEVAGVERNGAEESFDTNNTNMPDGSNATEPRDLPENELEGIRKENEELTNHNLKLGSEKEGLETEVGKAVITVPAQFSDFQRHATIEAGHKAGLQKVDVINEPVAVRYAWADNPVCNLQNKAGLPATPFRTDNWPGITAKVVAP